MVEDPILRAHQERQAARRKLVDEVTKRFADEGKLIEAGWASLRMLTIAADAPAAQLEELRVAFFAGAQHLFGAMMSMLDPGQDATDADLRKMDLIHKELGDFVKVFEQRRRPAGRA